MAIRNLPITKRTVDISEYIQDFKDEIGDTEKDLRRIVGEEYDNYTQSQKDLAAEVYTQRNMFFNPDGTARSMIGAGPNKYAGKTFDDTLLGEVIRGSAPLYKTPDTMGEGLVNRKYKEDVERDRMEMMTRPRPDTYYERQRKEAEKNLPSELDDFSGYAEGMNRLETELDPTSPRFRQKLSEGGTVEDAPFSDFFTTQRSYTPDEYKAGFVNFYGGSLGTGINVTTVGEDEDEDKDEEETVLRQDVLRPVGQQEDSIVSPTQYTFGDRGRQSAFDVRSYSYGDGQSDFNLNIDNFEKAGTQDLSDSFVKDYMKSIKGPGVQADVKKEGVVGGLTVAMGPVLATAAGTFMGKDVAAPFGKDTTFRPAGLAGFALDAALNFHTKNAAAVNLVGGKAGALMTVNNMMISRRPGSYIYTGNLGNLSQEQMLGLEATKEGFISGTLKDEYDSDTNTWTKTGMKGLLDADTAFRVGGNVSETGYFIGTFGGGAKLTGRAGLENEQFAAAYNAAFSKFGVTQEQFRSALLQAQTKAGAFGTVRGKHRNATFLTDALTAFQTANVEAQKKAERDKAEKAAAAQAEKAAQDAIRARQQDAARAADAAAADAARRRNEKDEDEERAFSGNEYGFDSGQSFGVGSSGGFAGALASGGRVGLQEGGQAVAPAGFVEGPPSQFTDDQKVADDKNMQVEEGTFVLNAAAVEEAGSEDIKKMILDAYAVAREQGMFEVDRPVYEKAVDVAVSRGEVIIPPQLARIIGYDRLRKINNRGKKETQERIDESEEQPRPQGYNLGDMIKGFLGFGGDDEKAKKLTPPDRGQKQGFIDAQKKSEVVESAEPSTPLPPPSPYEETVRSALQAAEDNRMKGYVPTDKSGVTIGRGFDIGQHSITDLERMGLNTAMLSKLTPYVGSYKEGKFVAKTGAKAREALKRDPLTIKDQKVLEELNLTVQRKKHEEFEDFLRRYKVPVPTDEVDKAVMFTEYYVGNFKTGVGPKEGSFYSKENNRHVTIRDSFLKAFKEGNGYDALYDGIIIPLRGKNSQKARETRNRADRMIKWWSENKDFPSITEPMSFPKLPKPDKPIDMKLPMPKPKRD
tara:strand:+ start:104 stop:3361 length:3258 start_codon:yes stop_codon:yes gene_type:complete